MNADSPLRLSVVIPAYGVEGYLGSCLRSILIDDSADFEVIVVDDASPDASGAIAADYAALDPRVRIVRHPVNRGLGAARNTGLLAANGTYVTFADSDDMLAPQIYRHCTDHLDRTGSDFATFPAEEFGKQRRRYWTTTAPIFDRGGDQLTLTDAPEMIRDHTAWNKVFRRSFLLDHDIRWPVGVKCEDVGPSVTAYLATTSFDVLSEVGYFYRRRSGSITTALGSDRTLLDWANQIRAAYDKITASSPSPSLLKEFIATALGIQLVSRFAAIAEAGPEVTTACIELTRALLPACPHEILLQINPTARWQLAALHLGRPDLIAVIARPDPRWRLDSPIGPSAADLPPNLLAVLGLGDSSFADGFHARFLDRRAAAPGTPLLEYSGDPELSVIVPAHNVESYIDELLHSIRLAHGVALEVLVVDDNSTDGTWERIQEHAAADPRVRPVRSAGRGGGQARGCGIELARGEYIAFADGDDLVPSHAYATLIKAARDTRSQVVSGSYVLLQTTNTWDASKTHFYNARLEAISLNQRPGLITHRVCWNRVYRRDFWLSRALPFPGVPRANDLAPIASVLLSADRMSVVPVHTYAYRRRPGEGSMTAQAGSADAALSYLTEEILVAHMVNHHADPLVMAAYWAAILNNDCWSHVRARLSTWTPEDAGADVLIDTLKSLLRLAPAAFLEDLPAVKRATYQLVLADQLDPARELSGWPDAGVDIDIAARPAAFAAVAEHTSLTTAELARLVHEFFVLRMIRRVPEVTSETAAAMGALVASLGLGDYLRAMVLPTFKESRVAAALTDPSGAALMGVLAGASSVAATLHHGLTRSQLTGPADALITSQTMVVGVGRINGDEVHIPLGRLDVAPNGDWSAQLHRDRLPAGTALSLTLETLDNGAISLLSPTLTVRALGPLSRIQPVSLVPGKVTTSLLRRGKLTEWLPRIASALIGGGRHSGAPSRGGAVAKR